MSELLVKGEIDFKVAHLPYKTDGTYFTQFWASVDHTGVVIRCSDDMLYYAVRRLTSLRKNKLLSFDPFAWHAWEEKMRARQGVFIEAVQPLLAHLAASYSEFFNDYNGAFQEAADHHADPHVKRLLRIHGWQELHDEGTLHDRIWLRHILYKGKKGEIAKLNKYLRAIGDLGVHASLQGFRVTKLLKTAMEQKPLRVNGGEICFVSSPNADKMEDVFAQLISPRGRFYFCYFSDDSCFSVRIQGKVFRYNVDISSCDASHTEALFSALCALVPEQAREDMEVLVEQCRAHFKVRSTADPQVRVKIKFDTAVLPSGSTITTVINNLANILLGYAFSCIEFTGANDPSQLISQAAAMVGYVVTVDDASEDWHLLQFLKNSPVIDTDGKLRSLLNLGVLLRLSGRCRGDLPGEGDLFERAKAFQDGLLRGVYPQIGFTLIDRMRATVKGSLATQKTRDEIAVRVERKLEYKVNTKARFTVGPSEVYKRYGLTATDIDFLETQYANSGFGDFANHPVLSKILEMDYGISCRELRTKYPNGVHYASG